MSARGAGSEREGGGDKDKRMEMECYGASESTGLAIAESWELMSLTAGGSDSGSKPRTSTCSAGACSGGDDHGHNVSKEQRYPRSVR